MPIFGTHTTYSVLKKGGGGLKSDEAAVLKTVLTLLSYPFLHIYVYPGLPKYLDTVECIYVK
jgi:hypothetical protein